MSTELKIIRSSEQYQNYLAEVESLMETDVALTSKAQERLDLLCLLIQDYESRTFTIDLPDPIDAIIFRMKELNLKQADLAPYFGTTSRVSEILNRKRSLTVEMIRALSTGLGIPAEILVSSSKAPTHSNDTDIDWGSFPIREMAKRGWIDFPKSKKLEEAAGIVKNFFESAGIQLASASFRRSLLGEAYSPTSQHALYAWLSRVVHKSRENRNGLAKFDSTLITKEFLRSTAQLSWSDKGPLIAIEHLQLHGISVVIEPHLKGTRVDGAALKDTDGTPIIALTLRYDRLDNFWFTLLHELAHVMCHLDDASVTFIDDIDQSSSDAREAEANRLAREAFIPRGLWKSTDASIHPSRENIEQLARKLKIHPSIIAGRIRQESRNYTIFNDLVGQNEVRKLFPNLQLETR